MVTRQRATAADVARVAGVNQSTVSRALKGDGKISPETRARVLAAAEKLSYTPNAIARGLTLRRTGMVGLVIAGITSPFQPYVLEMFIRELEAIGRSALVFSPAPSQDVDDLVPTILEYQVDGLIVTSATLSSRRLTEVARRGTPVILFNRTGLGDVASAICCDNVAGGREVADYLLDTGHRRLAYIAGNPDSSTNRDREQGFIHRVWERGAPKPQREQAAYTYESGYDAARRVLARDEPPDAIFCASDITALGAIDGARMLGVGVPRDISIVGFDDIPMARWPSYALTTVRQPLEPMIRATLEMLQHLLTSAEADPEIRLFPGSLIERSSTRRRDGAAPVAGGGNTEPPQGSGR